MPEVRRKPADHEGGCGRAGPLSNLACAKILLCVAIASVACGSGSPNAASQVPGEVVSQGADDEHDPSEPPAGVEQPGADPGLSSATPQAEHPDAEPSLPARGEPDAADPESSSDASDTDSPSGALGGTPESSSQPDADSSVSAGAASGDSEPPAGVEQPQSGADAPAGGAEPDDPNVRADPDPQLPDTAAPRILPAVPVGADGVQRWTVEIIESFPHDPEAFTQGLETSNGAMYESTGLWGQSSLRIVDPATGEVITQTDLAEQYFGEGLTVVENHVIQLTWQSGTAFVYDRATLSPVAQHRYEGEGWGLCLMDEVLIMSNGSDQLTHRDPHSFEPLATVTVNAAAYGGRLDHLNELECVEDSVIANVWQTDRLLVIDPATGRVTAEIDASPLVADAAANSSHRSIDVLNGVAVDESTATLWMTGKLWPWLYRVRIVEAP